MINLTWYRMELNRVNQVDNLYYCVEEKIHPFCKMYYIRALPIFSPLIKGEKSVK